MRIFVEPPFQPINQHCGLVVCFEICPLCYDSRLFGFDSVFLMLRESFEICFSFGIFEAAEIMEDGISYRIAMLTRGDARSGIVMIAHF